MWIGSNYALPEVTYLCCQFTDSNELKHQRQTIVTSKALPRAWAPVNPSLQTRSPSALMASTRMGEIRHHQCIFTRLICVCACFEASSVYYQFVVMGSSRTSRDCQEYRLSGIDEMFGINASSWMIWLTLLRNKVYFHGFRQSVRETSKN